jgi:aryl-alcohol dehydrogenase-like predicted oxidoreductase
MEHRQLGRTGVSVSKLCLGAMMFGAWRQPRPRRVDPHHAHGVPPPAVIAAGHR